MNRKQKTVIWVGIVLALGGLLVLPAIHAEDRALPVNIGIIAILTVAAVIVLGDRR